MGGRLCQHYVEYTKQQCEPMVVNFIRLYAEEEVLFNSHICDDV